MTPGGRSKGSNSQSYGVSKIHSQGRNVNLPKLERIIIKGTANKNPVLYHQPSDL